MLTVKERNEYVGAKTAFTWRRSKSPPRTGDRTMQATITASELQFDKDSTESEKLCYLAYLLAEGLVFCPFFRKFPKVIDDVDVKVQIELGPNRFAEWISAHVVAEPVYPASDSWFDYMGLKDTDAFWNNPYADSCGLKAHWYAFPKLECEGTATLTGNLINDVLGSLNYNSKRRIGAPKGTPVVLKGFSEVLDPQKGGISAGSFVFDFQKLYGPVALRQKPGERVLDLSGDLTFKLTVLSSPDADRYVTYVGKQVPDREGLIGTVSKTRNFEIPAVTEAQATKPWLFCAFDLNTEAYDVVMILRKTGTRDKTYLLHQIAFLKRV